MGHEAIHAPGQEVIHEIFLGLHTHSPAISAKILTHTTAFFPGINGSHGSPHSSQHVMVKARVILTHGRQSPGHILSSRPYLASDVVDARHVLTGQSPEEMAHARPQIRIGIAVLQHVTDILHSMSLAPVPQLSR